MFRCSGRDLGGEVQDVFAALTGCFPALGGKQFSREERDEANRASVAPPFMSMFLTADGCVDFEVSL